MAVVSKGKAKPGGKGAPAKKSGPPLPKTLTCPKCGYSGPAGDFTGSGPAPEEPAGPPAMPPGMPGGAAAGGQLGF